MPLYHARKKHLADMLTQDLSILENRVRFIREIISNKLTIANRKRADLMDELRKRGYASQTISKKKNSESVSDESDKDDSEIFSGDKNYDYLLGMPLWNITNEKVLYFEQELAKKKDELDKLLATPPSHLWRHDLDQFVESVKLYEEEQLSIQNATGIKLKKGGRSKAPVKNTAHASKSAKDPFEAKVAKKVVSKPLAAKAVVSKSVASKPAVSKPKKSRDYDSEDSEEESDVSLESDNDDSDSEVVFDVPRSSASTRSVPARSAAPTKFEIMTYVY